MNLQKHIKEIVITLTVISITAGAYATLSTVNTGDGLTATLWNSMVTDINSCTDKLNGIYNSSGNIGIGTSTPGGKLHVNGAIMSENPSAPADKKKWHFGTTSDGTFYFQGINDSGAGGGNVIYFTRGTGPNISQTQFVSSGNPFMVIDHYSTNVGIGTTTPSAKLDVAGNVNVTGRIFDTGMPSGSSGYYVCKAANGELNYGASCSSSDGSLKDDINTLDNSLEKISRLRGVSYYWNDNEKWRGKGRQIGVIAQEIEKEYPEVVSENEKGIKSVNYEVMVGPLIESVKELKKENDDLKKRIEALENK